MADSKKTSTTEKKPVKVATKAARRSETQVEKTVARDAPVSADVVPQSAIIEPETAPTLFTPKSDTKPDPIADAVARVAAPTLRPARAVAETIEASVVTASAAVVDVAAPAARLIGVGTEQTRDVYARALATTASFRDAITECANATTRGAFEVNDKVIDAWRAQSDAAFDVLQSALKARTLSDAIHVQTSGARQVYETAASHWRDVAESTTRWLGSAVKPLQSALTRND